MGKITLGNATVAPRGTLIRGSLILFAILALVISGLIFTPASGAPTSSLHSIRVQLASDGAITAVAQGELAKDSDGAASTNLTPLIPSEAAQKLPLRVQTSWWSGSDAGTDLALATGADGPVTLRLDVQNLTSTPELVSFETGGVRYSQQALVGVPLTVIATANLGAIAPESVTDATINQGGQVVTDGVITQNAAGEVIVQWSRMLAPPMLPAAASFNVVVDSPDFVAPDFQLSVQPGILTDPGVSTLLVNSFAEDGKNARLEESTLNLVVDVRTSLHEALDFIDAVHFTLQGDVSTLSTQIVHELDSSARAVLSHLDSTVDRLAAVDQSTQTAMMGAQTGAQASLLELNSAVQAVLGNSQPVLTDSAVAGCQVTLPQLADDQLPSVTATVSLLSAQLQTLAGSFSDDDDAVNCRAELVAGITSQLGDYNAFEAGDEATIQACELSEPADRTLACSLFLAQDEVETGFNALAAELGTATATQESLDAQGLLQILGGEGGIAASLTQLREVATDGDTSAATSTQYLHDWATDLLGSVEAAQDLTVQATTQLIALYDAGPDVADQYDQLMVLVTGGATSIDSLLSDVIAATDSAQPVGAWFAESDYVAALGDLVLLAANEPFSTCQVDWADGLHAGSTLAEITAALSTLNVPGCTVAPVAQATIDLAAGFDQLTSAASSANGDANTALTQYQAIVQQLQDLGVAVDALTGLGDEQAGLSILTALYESGAEESGVLAQLHTELTTFIESLDSEDGDIQQTQAALTQIRQIVEGLWPGEPVMVLDPALFNVEDFDPEILTSEPYAELELESQEELLEYLCTEPETPAAELGARLVEASGLIFCVSQELNAALTGLADDLDDQSGATAAQIAELQAHTQAIFSATGEHISDVTAGFSQTISGVQADTESSLLSLVDSASAQLQAQLDATLADLGLTLDDHIADLATQLAETGSESVAVSDQLAANFETLAANLGAPGATTSTGMLGKLFNITAQVGDTGSVLSSTDTQVTTHGNSRLNELKALGLAAAQYQRSRELLHNYDPFGTADSQATTVFIYHVAGGN